MFSGVVLILMVVSSSALVRRYLYGLTFTRQVSGRSFIFVCFALLPYFCIRHGYTSVLPVLTTHHHPEHPGQSPGSPGDYPDRVLSTNGHGLPYTREGQLNWLKSLTFPIILAAPPWKQQVNFLRCSASTSVMYRNTLKGTSKNASWMSHLQNSNSTSRAKLMAFDSWQFLALIRCWAACGASPR